MMVQAPGRTDPFSSPWPLFPVRRQVQWPRNILLSPGEGLWRWLDDFAQEFVSGGGPHSLSYNCTASPLGKEGGFCGSGVYL